MMGAALPTTTTTPIAEFETIFRELVIALQPRGLERDTLRVYHETLALFSVAVLRESAKRLRQRSKFFPTTGEWFDAATEVQWEARHALLDEPTTGAIECSRCDDTGSVYASCPGDATCGRPRAHSAHDFVCVCACRTTNVNYQRKRASDPVRGTDE